MCRTKSRILISFCAWQLCPPTSPCWATKEKWATAPGKTNLCHSHPCYILCVISSRPCQPSCCGTGCCRQLPVLQVDREWWWLWQEHWKDWNASALAGETEMASSVWQQPARLEVVNAIFTETFLWLRASFFKPLEIFLEQPHKCSLCVCTDLLAQGVVAFPQYFSPVTEVYAQLEPAVFHSCAAFTFHS